MKIDIKYNNHPADTKNYDTMTLRQRFLIECIFVPDEITLTYSHHDRIICGGIMPITTILKLPVTQDLGTSYFLERREMGVINVGGPGFIILDGIKYSLSQQDGMYIGLGTKDIQFASDSQTIPAKFYINSVPAHHAYPNKYISLQRATPVHLGSQKTLNERTIYQFIHPSVCESCQLIMGMTILNQGSVWNTMPCHTHERRMEVYFYFNMDPETRVIHLMGEPSETRHLIVKNEQALISPSWSIHSGVGTSNYTFIWGMCGENITFTDMDFVPMSLLK